MSISAKRVTIEDVNVDNQKDLDAFDASILAEGNERIRVEVDECVRLGIVDSEGNLLIQELPEDMREDAATDFGG
jgi:hypothetical protein